MDAEKKRCLSLCFIHRSPSIYVFRWDVRDVLLSTILLVLLDLFLQWVRFVGKKPSLLSQGNSEALAELNWRAPRKVCGSLNIKNEKSYVSYFRTGKVCVLLNFSSGTFFFLSLFKWLWLMLNVLWGMRDLQHREDSNCFACWFQSIDHRSNEIQLSHHITWISRCQAPNVAHSLGVPQLRYMLTSM